MSRKDPERKEMKVEDKKNIKVDRLQYIKKGGCKGREINAIIQELPINEERFSNLVKTIKEKEDKVSTYLEACPEVDLIIEIERWDK